ncbi:hypothetical protein Bca4012_037147 [Brassica carinata]
MGKQGKENRCSLANTIGLQNYKPWFDVEPESPMTSRRNSGFIQLGLLPAIRSNAPQGGEGSQGMEDRDKIAGSQEEEISMMTFLTLRSMSASVDQMRANNSAST